MDHNKLSVLVSIGYEINPCCGLCANGEFLNPNSDFGVCKANTYQHIKHGNIRDLSVHRFGRCQVDNEFIENPFAVVRLDDFNRFLNEE